MVRNRVASFQAVVLNVEAFISIVFYGYRWFVQAKGHHYYSHYYSIKIVIFLNSCLLFFVFFCFVFVIVV